MKDMSLLLVAVSAAATLVHLASGDVEATLARCCAQGANWAREEEACADFPTPVAGEASEHQSLCLTAAAICCLRLYREQQCEAGKQAAQRGRPCRLPAALGGEYYKDCCEGCKLGLVSGAMALSCSFSSLEFGFPWDIAYTQCCTHLHPQLPLLPREAPQETDNSVLYPGSTPVAERDNLCLQFPGQLCAHVCVPAPGSYTCQCRAGFVLSVDKKTCLQEEPVDRCADNDACEHICRDTGIAVVCACDPGYRLADDDRSCDDVDECKEGLHSCTPGQQLCHNQRGSYACVNPDGSLSLPWVQPHTSPVSRGPLAVGLGLGNGLSELLGGSSGPCPTGYRYSSLTRVCDDVDECLTVPGLCGRGSLCANTIGSYSCTEMPPDTCPPGYSFDLLLQSCRDIDECTDGTDNCDRSTQFCINTQGSFACQQLGDTTACPAGYKYNTLNKACEDVNECAEVLSVCSEEEVCRNTVGAYDCELRCDEGFLYSSGLQSCVDVDECLQGEHNCVPGVQVCVNEPGSHRCEDLASRLDEDRLLLALGGIRGVNASSVARGEVQECPAGYGFDFNSRQCLDIDECQGGVHQCDPATERCINTLGSFRCRAKRTCPVGYVKAATGECVDVDECEHKSHSLCLPGQVCVNTPGSFECQVECRDGFRYDPSHPLTCADIDECSNSPCAPDEVCLNTDGSFVCRRPRHRHDGSRRKGQQGHNRRGPQTDRDRDRPGRNRGGGADRAGSNRDGSSDRNRDGSSDRNRDGSSDRNRDGSSDRNRDGSSDRNRDGSSDRNRDGSSDREASNRDSCLPGYARPNEEAECEDVDECETGAAHCLPEEVCLNHPGGYRCSLPPSRARTCPPGHRYQHHHDDCLDVNECEERLDDCSASTQTCVNSVGSYRCVDRTPTCSFGYRYDSATRRCVDIDECKEGRDFCDVLTESCSNLPGGYRCDQLRSPSIDLQSGEGSSPLGPLTPLDPFSPEDIGSPNRNFGPSFVSNEDTMPVTDEAPGAKISPEEGPQISPSLSTPDETMDEKSNITSKGPFQIPSLWVPPNPEPSVTPHLEITSITTSSPSPASTNTTSASPAPSPPPSTTAATNASSPCPPNFFFDATSSICRDIDECESSPCEPEERCSNTLGSYECRCQEGYKLDVGTGRCKDVNECQLGTYDCGESQRCDNTIGSYTCVRISGCGTGYTLNHNNGLCEDNDECESGMHDCGQLGPQWRCVNTKGSFRCEKKLCPDLQYLDPFGLCVNLTCPPGYRPLKKSCVDVDECAEPGLSNCRSNENCVNLLGSFSCRPKMVCGRGFTLNEMGTGCVDIDECATGAHECSGGQQCHNRRGTYTCQCRPGYRLDARRQCRDIDECAAYYGAACSSNAVCENTPGSFLCHCNDGFEQAEGGRNCIDIDECSRDANVCHHRCINIRGSYQCICNAGYNIAPDNRTCIDVDECEETRQRGRGRLCVGVCENTPGSFQCSCPPGYTLLPDLRTCKDNNECERDSVCRGASEQCINTRGGFRCMEIACPAGYIRDTSHKSRCKKRSLYCRNDDLVCQRQPLSYSYNFLPLASNMSFPSTGQVDLFTMRGPLWATSIVRFALELESVRSPTGVAPAVRESFILRRTSVNQAVISLQQQLEGPQEVQIALSMKLYHGNEYSGSAVAKLLIIVSEYDF